MKLYDDCQDCPLGALAKNKVIHRGSFTPKVVFVGESGGKSEDEAGIPFVGKSGKLLDQWLSSLGLPESDYAIVNSVFCRAGDGDVDRKPTQEELDACEPNFVSFLNSLKPQVIVALGRTAEARLKALKIRHFFIYHPAYFIRRGGTGWEEDLSKLKTQLLPIISQRRL